MNSPSKAAGPYRAKGAKGLLNQLNPFFNTNLITNATRLGTNIVPTSPAMTATTPFLCSRKNPPALFNAGAGLTKVTRTRMNEAAKRTV